MRRRRTPLPILLLPLAGLLFAAPARAHFTISLLAGTEALSGKQSCDVLACGLDGVSPFTLVTVTAVASCEFGGFLGAYYGLQVEGPASYTGASPAPDFIFAPNFSITNAGATSTVGCTECCTAVVNHSFLLTGAGAVTITVTPYVNLGSIVYVSCDFEQYDADCGGRATINAEGVDDCGCGSHGGQREDKTWGQIKSLYR